MIGGLFHGQTPKDVAGPVGIFAVSTQAAKFGTLSLINFIEFCRSTWQFLIFCHFRRLTGKTSFITIEG